MNLTDYDKRAQSQSNKVPAHLEHAIMAVRDTSPQFLESPEGEISFFRSVMRARPVGMHRHFHVLTIRNAIQKDTGHLVSIDDIWVKLRSCYDLDALENLVSILPHGKMIIQTLIPSKEIDGYDLPGSNKSTPPSIPSPSASENLSVHPFFRQEYTLPSDESFEALVSPRRIRATASPPSSPALSSPGRPGHRKTRRGRSKADMAGLVGGDSDSSALTQESGDEGEALNTRGSGMDGGTDSEEEEDDEPVGMYHPLLRSSNCCNLTVIQAHLSHFEKPSPSEMTQANSKRLQSHGRWLQRLHRLRFVVRRSERNEY